MSRFNCLVLNYMVLSWPVKKKYLAVKLEIFSKVILLRPYYTMRLVCVLVRFVIENARKM